MSITTITNIAEFVEKLAEIPLRKGCTRFFRGHADYKKFKIEPSIFRKEHLRKNEELLIQDGYYKMSNRATILTFIY